MIYQTLMTTRPKKNESKHFGQNSLKFRVDGQDQRAKLRWNIGVLAPLLQRCRGRGYANLAFLAFLEQPLFTGFFRLAANVSRDFGVIDLVDDRGNLFQSFFDVHVGHLVSRIFSLAGGRL